MNWNSGARPEDIFRNKSSGLSGPRSTISDMDLFAGDWCPDKVALSTSLLSLLDRLPAVLWATDLEHRFTALTGAGLATTGVTAASYAGKPIEALFSGSKLTRRALAAHQKALQGTGGSFDVEWNGCDLEAHVEPLYGQDGAIVGAIGVALDATERLVAERTLRISERSYRSLIEEAPYAICRATESGQLLQVNRGMLEMLGYDPTAEADLLVRDLPLIFATPESFEMIRHGLLRASAIQGMDSTWLRRDGQEIQVRVGGRAIRDLMGQVLYLDLLAENVTELKELEARLSQAEKMQAIGQLAGGVAHDFNNLLTVISGQVEVVLGKVQDADLQRRLEDVERAAARAAALTKQLLAFSRRQVMQTKIVDLNRLIDHLSHMLTRLIREDIELSFLPGSDLGFVRADPNQLEQVLMNLTVNAQDAMPRGGRLTIETAKAQVRAEAAQQPQTLDPGDYVLITVRDTGHGMEPEVQARIFEPFFTTKKTGEGTGLGLAMAYGIVRQSGGYIQAESRPGQGSAFQIYLPRIVEPEPVRPEPLGAVSPAGCETIVLAEDEDSVRELVAVHLRSLGYQVLTASDGPAALEVAHSHPGPIDMLLSDLVMPRMGGRELAEELRKTVTDLRVIFVSGYAGHDAARTELEFPNAYFLPKPFTMHRLATAIREVLDSSPGESTWNSFDFTASDLRRE